MTETVEKIVDRTHPAWIDAAKRYGISHHKFQDALTSLSKQFGDSDRCLALLERKKHVSDTMLDYIDDPYINMSVGDLQKARMQLEIALADIPVCRIELQREIESEDAKISMITIVAVVILLLLLLLCCVVLLPGETTKNAQPTQIPPVTTSIEY